MMRRLDSSGSAVLPWPIPQLDKPEAPPPEPAAPPADQIPAAPPAEAHNSDASSAEQSALREILDREAARGYADGVERGLAEGKKQGYADGFSLGAEAGKESLAQEAGRLAALIDGLRAPIRSLDRFVEEALIALALEVARCVIGNEVALSHDYLVRLIRQTLAAVPVPKSGLRILLNPQDLELVRSLAPEIESGGAALLADADVETGGCRILLDDEPRLKERRWQERDDVTSQIDLSLAARWRSVMVSLFEGDRP